MARKLRARLAPRQSRNCTNGSVPPYDAAIEISSNGRPKAGRFALMDDDSRFAPTFTADGSLVRGRGSEGQELAVRAEMGWFPLPGVSRRQKGRTAIEVRPIPHTLFPRNVAAVAALKAKRFVLDSEVVVPRGQAFSFDDLLQRIHPAESRVKRLAAETPALLI